MCEDGLLVGVFGLVGLWVEQINFTKAGCIIITIWIIYHFYDLDLAGTISIRCSHYGSIRRLRDYDTIVSKLFRYDVSSTVSTWCYYDFDTELFIEVSIWYYRCQNTIGLGVASKSQLGWYWFAGWRNKRSNGFVVVFVPTNVAARHNDAELRTLARGTSCKTPSQLISSRAWQCIYSADS